MSDTPKPEEEALRHAEKARNATCAWADRVATEALTKYRAVFPQDITEAFAQTVVAAFLLFDSRADSLEVVSVAAGTKFLSCEALKADSNCDAVRDCHAEILAKRAFQQLLFAEAGRALKTTSSTRAVAVDNKIQLKDGFSVHFYTSSQPCGNACVKRWGKGDKKYTVDASVQELCAPAKHEKIHIMQRSAGQIALSVKGTSCAEPSEQGLRESGGDVILAPSTALPGSPGVQTHTCSDKIAVWNVLGVQGTLLSSVWSPVYIATITVGRKFSELHARRAMCCRLQELRCPQKTTRYRLNHPWFLCTSVKLDTSVKKQSETATFDDNRCLLWSANGGVEVLDGSTGLLVDGGVSSIARSRRRSFFCEMLGKDEDEESDKPYMELKRSVLEGCQERAAVREELYSTIFSDWSHSQ